MNSVAKTLGTKSAENSLGMRKETDSLGVVEVPVDKLWGAQTPLTRALQHWPCSHSKGDDYGLRDFEEGRRDRKPCRETTRRSSI